MLLQPAVGQRGQRRVRWLAGCSDRLVRRASSLEASRLRTVRNRAALVLWTLIGVVGVATLLFARRPEPPATLWSLLFVAALVVALVLA